MTDSKSVTRSFQTKMIPPPLWNACDFVFQFNFTLALIPGTMNTAADFLFRLQMDPNEKINLKIREDIPTQPIKVDIDSTGIAQEEPIFFDTTDQHECTEKNFGNVKNKHETPNLTIHHSSQCRVFMQMTYTKKHNICECNTFNQSITYTRRTSFSTHFTKFQRRNVGTTI